MDLDEDLLALAAGSEEDNYSPAEDDYYEEEDEEDKALSRKKRKIVSEDDDEDDDDDGLKNPYPLEGKFKDDADRDSIMAMDDLQREAILFERSQELERFQERKYLELRAKKDKMSEAERIRSRKKGKTTTKADKRELLRAERKKAQNRRRGYADEDEGDDEDVDDEDVDEGDDDDDDYGYARDDDDDDNYGFADLKRDREPEKQTTLADINNIHIGRQLFGKYSMYPEFADVVRDCYAKVNVGTNSQSGQNEYRMVQIKDVVEEKDKVYALLSKKTNLYVVVSIGKSQRRVPMSIFSDRAISNAELQVYRERLEKDNLELLSLRQISRKYYELREMARRNLTDQEITAMIARREEFESDFATVNVVMKKTNLQQQRVIALENDDFDRAQELEAQLKRLEADIAANHRVDESVLARVNEKNKKLNQEIIRQAELRAIEAKLKDQSKDDPFSRLKTRTKMFYKGGADGKPVKVDETKDEMLARLQDEKSAAEAARAQKLHATFRDAYGGFDDVVRSIGVVLDVDL